MIQTTITRMMMILTMTMILTLCDDSDDNSEDDNSEDDDSDDDDSDD